jgi:hypothetical protein
MFSCKSRATSVLMAPCGSGQTRTRQVQEFRSFAPPLTPIPIATERASAGAAGPGEGQAVGRLLRLLTTVPGTTRKFLPAAATPFWGDLLIGRSSRLENLLFGSRVSSPCR